MQAKHYFYGAIMLSIAGCVSCTGADVKSPTKMVDEIAENCRRGMGEASVHKEEDELDVNVKCAK
jgi:hypothetical protein